MSERDVSIVFKASDRLSESVRSMRQGVKGLESDVERYKKLQHQVFEEKAKVKLDITQAKQNIKELEKAVKSGADGAKEAFLEQQTALESLNDEYKRLTKLQSEVMKGEKELSTTFSRSSNANAGRGMGATGMMGALIQAGLGGMLGSATGEMLGSMATSVFGSTIGGAITSIGGGALSGAAMGSIAGPHGAAIGAAIGGLTGAIQTLTSQQQKMDDLYREEVKSLHSDAIADVESRVTGGSAIAAEREMYRRGFESTLGKEMGRSLYEQIKTYGDDTNYDTTAMLGKGKEMLTYGIAGGNVMEMMKIIGDIAGGNTNNFSGLSYAISQSMAAGKLNAQDKNQMINYGFNPLEFVAKAQGISVSDATKMMSSGQISSDMLMDALRLATSEGERFYQGTAALSDTFDGMMGQLESAWSDIEAAAGEGYNTKRKEGMAAEIEALTGEAGQKMKAAYEMVGAYEAEMENQYQQSIVKAMEGAAKTIEEKGLEGIEAEKVMWEAKTNAEIEYKNGEEYQKKLQAEKSLVASIQGALTESGEYVAFGQAMADQFSKGWQGARMANASADVGSHINPVWRLSGSHAAGLGRVPHDGYLAELHEGERVLTRVEANQKGESITIAKLADQIIVREEADVDKIARAIVSNIQREKEGYVGAA